jgi:hypothetical protein
LPERVPDLSPLASLAVPVSAKGAGREYGAYPNLARVRWLFPAGRPAVRRAGIRALFHPRSVKGRVLKSLISAGGFRGERVFLEEPALAELEARLSRTLQERVGVAFYVGTPGAYRKATAQAVTPVGATLAFAKIAASPAAREDVGAEVRNLTRLSESGGLRGGVPDVLDLFDWRGAEVLLLSGGPPSPGPESLSPAHLAFLRDLFAPFAEETTFAESPMMRRTRERARLLKPSLPEPLSALLDEALGRLEEDLGPVGLPVSVAHRDFAPWNTRIGPHGLFVFDWDRAEDGMPPLYDAFHFRAIQAALSGRGDPVPDRRFLRELLDAVWPGGRGHLASLYLAYLLDQTLFYGAARAAAPDAGERGVWDWFAERLRAFLEADSPL